MESGFGYKVKSSVKALSFDDYYVWDCSVIKQDGRYHMFSSRWDKKYGFGSSWLFHSEIIHAVSDRPEGPYVFQNVVLSERGRKYFDGMNTHNTCIKKYNNKFYLYYMGCTYGIESPQAETDLTKECIVETMNRKRIGVAIADDIDGEFVRKDSALLEPRDCSYWDCTFTTNPSVVIMPDGKTYMIYKSRKGSDEPLQLGIAVADCPDGKFERISDVPIFDFPEQDFHIEDPFIWYDDIKNKFCLIAKDDFKNNSGGITGEWGSGFYAESDDCINFSISKKAKVYSRELIWEDGRKTIQCNLERPSILFDESGKPTHIFCASGDGQEPYGFEGNTYIVCMKLEQTGINV